MRVTGALCTELDPMHGIYLISRNDRAPYKVGFSIHVGRRLNSYRTYANGALHLHAVIAYPSKQISEAAYAHQTETKIHRVLSSRDDCTRMRFWDSPEKRPRYTEWFETSLSQRAFVTAVIRFALDHTTPSPDFIARWAGEIKYEVYHGAGHTQTRSGRLSRRRIQDGTTDTYLGTHTRIEAARRLREERT